MKSTATILQSSQGGQAWLGHLSGELCKRRVLKPEKQEGFRKKKIKIWDLGMGKFLQIDMFYIKHWCQLINKYYIK